MVVLQISAPVRSAHDRSAPVKSAPHRFALNRSASPRFALRRSAPDRFAPRTPGERFDTTPVDHPHLASGKSERPIIDGFHFDVGFRRRLIRPTTRCNDHHNSNRQRPKPFHTSNLVSVGLGGVSMVADAPGTTQRSAVVVTDRAVRHGRIAAPCVRQVRPRQVRRRQVRPLQVRRRQVRPHQACTRQVRPRQVRPQ